MARIRTIKPEFWTDERIVTLPYEARLLFIGMWNFCDDEGYLWDEPSRIKLQVMPNDNVDVETIIDLLDAAGLIESYATSNDDKRALKIRHFKDHQKVDHPAASKIARETSRKVSIPLAARRAIAVKYGCKPGESIDAHCYYCGCEGKIHWQRLSSGKPGSWVYLSNLEIDHLEPEVKGGESSGINFVLACRFCNRSKKDKDIFEFVMKARETSRTVAPEWNGMDQGMDQVNNTKICQPEAQVDHTSKCDDVFDYWKMVMHSHKSKLDTKRKKLINDRLKTYSVDDLKTAIHGCSVSPFHMGTNDRGAKYNSIELILRDSGKIDQFIGYSESPPKAGGSALNFDFDDVSWVKDFGDAL